MSSSGNTSPQHFGPVVSPCGNTKPREHDASPNPRFPPRVLHTRWRKSARSCPNCGRTRVKNRRCQPVGSLVGHLGLQCSTRVRTHGFRDVASSLFGVKSQKAAVTAPEGAGGSELLLLDERCDASVRTTLAITSPVPRRNQENAASLVPAKTTRVELLVELQYAYRRHQSRAAIPVPTVHLSYYTACESTTPHH